MTIYLLTHQREVHRKTNTGVLVADVLKQNAEVVLWERTAPDQKLLEAIEGGNIALLFPSDESTSVTGPVAFENFIILDGTWQEARKIYNQSPYLHKIPKLTIVAEKPSVYDLRRNQTNEGVCTAEVVVKLFKDQGKIDLSQAIENRLIDFLKESKKV